MHFFPTLCFVLHFLQRDLWTSFVVVQLCKIRSIFQIELRKNSNGMMVSFFLLFWKRTWQEVYEWDCCYFEIKRYLCKSIHLYIWYENVYSDPNLDSTFKNVSKNYKCNFVQFEKAHFSHFWEDKSPNFNFAQSEFWNSGFCNFFLFLELKNVQISILLLSN